MSDRDRRISPSPSELISAYLDDELAEEEGYVEGLIERSDAWEARRDALLEIDALILELAAEDQSGLVDGLIRGDVEVPEVPMAPRARRWILGRWAAVAAAAIALGVFVRPTPLQADPRPSLASVVSAAADGHRDQWGGATDMALATTDYGELSDWLAEQRGIDRLPPWSASCLMGATPCELLGAEGATVYLQDPVGPVSVFVVPRDAVQAEADLPPFPGECARASEASACWWTDEDWLFVSLADRPEDRLQRALVVATIPMDEGYPMSSGPDLNAPYSGLDTEEQGLSYEHEDNVFCDADQMCLL